MKLPQRIAKLAALFGFAVACLAMPVGVVHAQTGTNVFDDVCRREPNSVLCKSNTQTNTGSKAKGQFWGPDGVLTKAAQIIAIVVGVAAVIVIIIGGLQYILSTGDSTKINNSKNMILYAIIGLVIALTAQAIISFVLRRL